MIKIVTLTFRSKLISDLKSLKHSIAEVCRNILKIKTENKEIFDSVKFSTTSSIYKRIVIEEKGSLTAHGLTDNLNSNKKSIQKNKSFVNSTAKIQRKSKAEKEQEVLKLIDSNKKESGEAKLRRTDTRSIFESIKNSLENHLFNERKIQKTIEAQMKKISFKDNPLVDITLAAFQRYLIDNKFEYSEEKNFFDLIDVQMLDKYHINNFGIALFKDLQFSRYLSDNFKKVNVMSLARQTSYK